MLGSYPIPLRSQRQLWMIGGRALRCGLSLYCRSLCSYFPLLPTLAVRLTLSLLDKRERHNDDSKSLPSHSECIPCYHSWSNHRRKRISPSKSTRSLRLHDLKTRAGKTSRVSGRGKSKYFRCQYASRHGWNGHVPQGWGERWDHANG